MALTSQQDIPQKITTSEPWSFRRLFPFGATGTLAKVFMNPFEVLLGYSILILGIAEIFGRKVSISFYIIVILLLITALFERNKTEVGFIEKKRKK